MKQLAVIAVVGWFLLGFLVGAELAQAPRTPIASLKHNIAFKLVRHNLETTYRNKGRAGIERACDGSLIKEWGFSFTCHSTPSATDSDKGMFTIRDLNRTF
jgi:hypothetical protein